MAENGIPLADAAHILNLSYRHIRRLCAEGKIKSYPAPNDFVDGRVRLLATRRSVNLYKKKLRRKS